MTAALPLGRTASMLKGLLLALATLTLAHAETAYFVCAGPRAYHDTAWDRPVTPEAYVAPVSDPAAIARIREYLRLHAQGQEKRAMILKVRLSAGADGINRNYAAPGRPLWNWHVAETLEAAVSTGEEITRDYVVPRDGSPSQMEDYAAGSGKSSKYGPSVVRLRYFPVLMEIVPESRAIVANVSCRGRISPEEPQLIAGFFVHGTAPKNVVIRVLGPTLGAFGVAAPLADPYLRLFEGTRPIRGNSSWIDDNLNAAKPPRVTPDLPTPLAPPSAAEPGVQVTLAPGAYTVVAGSDTGGSGVALIEVFVLED